MSHTGPSLTARINERKAGRRVAATIAELIDTGKLSRTALEALVEELSVQLLPPLAEATANDAARLREVQSHVLGFGKHQGQSLDQIELSYLTWLCDSSRHEYEILRDYIRLCGRVE
jgi:hypothetical protein